MPPLPQFWDSTDSTQITGTTSLALDAGTTSAPVVYHLYNEKGGSAATILKNARIEAKVFNGADRISSGYPILDEAWIQISVVGMDSSAAATMEAMSAGYQPVGAGRPLLLKDIPLACARYLSVQIVVPAGAPTVTQEVYLELVYDETSVVLPFRIGTITGSGVIPDRLDATLRRLRNGRTVTVSGAVATIAKGGFVYDGTNAFRVQETATLNQTAASGALALGESYIAVLSQPPSGAVTVTKGNKATTPTAPAVPSTDIFIAAVTVPYSGTGTSSLTVGNVSTTGRTYGEFLVTARSSTGAVVEIGAGTAVTSVGTQPFLSSTATATLPTNGTSTVYLQPDGTIFVAVITAPASGSLALAVCSTSSGNITSIVDARTFISRAQVDYVMSLDYRGQLAVANILDWKAIPTDAVLAGYQVHLGFASGTAGAHKFEVVYWSPPYLQINTAGTTLFTSYATQDLRPAVTTVPAGTQVVWSGSTVAEHEVTVFPSGSRFALNCVSLPAGSTTEDVTVLLIFRRP